MANEALAPAAGINDHGGFRHSMSAFVGLTLKKTTSCQNAMSVKRSGREISGNIRCLMGNVPLEMLPQVVLGWHK